MRYITQLLSLSLALSGVALADTPAPQTSQELLERAKASVQDITTEELAALIEQDPSVAVVDIRTRREAWLVGGSIDAPRHLDIPRGWLEFRIETSVPDRDTPIVVYCGTNQRSPLAAATLAGMGYTGVLKEGTGRHDHRACRRRC
jgi:rhodanese-related sulfurtransferase